MLLCPPENVRTGGNTTPMRDISDMLNASVGVAGFRFYDLQPVFGPATSVYSDSACRILISSADGIHPTATGAGVIEDTIKWLLIPSKRLLLSSPDGQDKLMGSTDEGVVLVS